LDEVRVALSHLDADRFPPDAPPTVSKALAALLRTAHPLTQTELAAKADVSARSIRRHLDALEALDLVRDVEDGGYRLALPNSDDERGRSICPEPVSSETAAPQDLLFDVALALVEDPGRLGYPDDPVGAAFAWPPDLDALRTHLPGLNPWVRVARSLSNAPDPPPATVTIGPDVEHTQTSLPTTTTAGGSP
ncbi:MAG: winged helix-turn-helix domain-containing protein, partial [Halovenus sp.]